MFAVAFGCVSAPATAVTERLLDTSAAERFLEIQDRLMLGEPVDESAWDALFGTPAYRWQAPDADVRARIRARTELAFQPDPGPLEAKLAAAEGGAAVRWRHHARMRHERALLGQFLNDLRCSKWLEEALEIAQGYLPPGSVDPAECTTPVRVLFFWPDAFADGGVIYLDLIEAADRGVGLKRLLAHEFHHQYYTAASEFGDLDQDAELYWAAQALVKLQMEGLADRIDKGGFPLPDLPGVSSDYRAQFNAHYLNAKETLARFDEALRRVPDAEDRAQSAQEAWSLLHFAGHVEGFFMANTIAEAQGEEALLRDFGDPFAFVRRFQAVCPTFSEETLAFLEQLEHDLRPRAHSTATRAAASHR